MDSQEIVRNWLREFTADGPLTLDERGVGEFEVDEIRLIVEVPDGSPVVHLRAAMATIPVEGAERFFRRLLELNFLTLETRGATFAVPKGGAEAVLCYSAPIVSLDAAGFANVVGNFLDTAAKWEEALNLAEFDDDAGETADAQAGEWTRI